MAFYQNSDQFYDCLQETFDRVTSNIPSSFNAIQRMNLTVRIDTTDPVIGIYVNGRDKPTKITLGPSTEKAVIVIAGSADTLHEVLLGTLGIMDSIKSKQLIVTGPMLKAVSLAEFFHGGQAEYPLVLKEKGYM
jgi:hypothetical protein